MENQPENEENTVSSKPEAFKSSKLLGIAGSFAFLIGIPLIALILLGKWLDARYETEYLVIIAIPVAILLSAAMVYRRIKAINDELKNK